MFGSMNYVKIWRESELECGDIAVYAAAGGTRATLIARVRAGERQERMHECIENSVTHGRPHGRPVLYGCRDHFGRVVLWTIGEDYYVPSAEVNRFLFGYRLFNAEGKSVRAGVRALDLVMDTDLGCDFAQLLETNAEIDALR